MIPSVCLLVSGGSHLVLLNSRTPAANETMAVPFNTDYFAYLSDESGIANRFIAYVDSYFHHYDNYYFFHDSTVVNPEYNIDSLVTANNLQLDSTSQVPVFRDTIISFPQSNYAKGIVEKEIEVFYSQRCIHVLRAHRVSFSIGGKNNALTGG